MRGALIRAGILFLGATAAWADDVPKTVKIKGDGTGVLRIIGAFDGIESPTFISLNSKRPLDCPEYGFWSPNGRVFSSCDGKYVYESQRVIRAKKRNLEAILKLRTPRPGPGGPDKPKPAGGTEEPGPDNIVLPAEPNQ